jgi:hypothetical protein
MGVVSTRNTLTNLRRPVLGNFEAIILRELRRGGPAGDAADVEFRAVEVEILLARHDGYMDSTLRGRAQRYGMRNYRWQDGEGRFQISDGFVDMIVRTKRKPNRGVLRDPSGRAKAPDFRASLWQMGAEIGLRGPQDDSASSARWGVNRANLNLKFPPHVADARFARCPPLLGDYVVLFEFGAQGHDRFHHGGGSGRKFAVAAERGLARNVRS